MEIKASAKNVRISPKKVRLVIGLIKGRNIKDAQAQLAFSKKNAAKSVLKVLNSAVANALHNYKIDQSNLFIKYAFVDDAITIKRWMPRAFGRATPLRKRGSHIGIVLGVLDSSKIKPKTEKEKQKDSKEERQAKDDIVLKKGGRADIKKEESVDEESTKSHSPEIFDVRMKSKHRHQQHEDKREMKGKGGFKKKIFNRKTES